LEELNKTILDEITEMVEEDLEIFKEVLKEDSETLKIVADPEKLLGKTVDLWDDNDIVKLQKIYGDSKRIKELLFNRDLEKLREMEALNGRPYYS
jgi:hypothetical protein